MLTHRYGYNAVADGAQKTGVVKVKFGLSVGGVLQGSARSRATAERTEKGSRSFDGIEQAVVDADDWIRSIQRVRAHVTIGRQTLVRPAVLAK